MKNFMAKKPIFSVDEQYIPKMPLKNWILAMLHDKGGRRSIDALSIMYETFIFIKEVLPSIESNFEFEFTGCGPYSENIAKAMKQLLSTNMLEIKKNEPSILGGYGYLLTKSGAKKAEQIFLQFPEALRDKMKFMNSVTGLMGLTGMLQYIHSTYPEYVYLHERREAIV
jgi:hypothetical protein